MNIPQYVIRFNPEFKRWEVITKSRVKRNGEIQPSFVSDSILACAEYIERREALT